MRACPQCEKELPPTGPGFCSTNCEAEWYRQQQLADPFDFEIEEADERNTGRAGMVNLKVTRNRLETVHTMNKRDLARLHEKTGEFLGYF